MKWLPEWSKRGSFLSNGLNWHKDLNDAIIGERIIVVARRIDKESAPIKESTRHRVQRAVAKRSARAWIDIAVGPAKHADDSYRPELDEWKHV